MSGWATLKRYLSHHLAIWIWVPLAVATYGALMGPRTAYSGMYDEALKARSSTVSGKLQFLDYRHRYIGFKINGKKVRVFCDMGDRTSRRCLPDDFAVPTDARIEFFKFKSRNIMLSAYDFENNVEFRKYDQLQHLKSESLYYKNDKRWTYFKFLYLAGLFLAGLWSIQKIGRNRQNKKTTAAV